MYLDTYWFFVPFQSTLPVGGGTLDEIRQLHGSEFQSTLPVWGGTFRIAYAYQEFLISIHPPRVGRDLTL